MYLGALILSNVRNFILSNRPCFVFRHIFKLSDSIPSVHINWHIEVTIFYNCSQMCHSHITSCVIHRRVTRVDWCHSQLRHSHQKCVTHRYVIRTKIRHSGASLQGRKHASKVRGVGIGKARIEDAKRLRFEGAAQIEGEARERAGRVWGWVSVSPSPDLFWNFKLQIVCFIAI